MDDKPVAALIQQISKPDVDAKIDAVSKLQAEFEKGSEIPDTDAAIQALKACLRISNQHLQTATLSALPAFLPLILGHGTSRAPQPHDIASTSSAGSSSVDIYTIRQVLNAFLPPGGVIDRLGDARERPREKARETFVLIGGFAFRAGGAGLGRSGGGKNAETVLQVFERFLRESGLSSKSPRVREQSVLALVEIRRAHHMFPLRPYLPLLVATLEDGDATVRETARNSIVALFTGPGVTDAARSDLKSQMTKKGVRKGTVDTVLERIFSKNAASSLNTPPASEDGHAQKEYIPPSQLLRERRPTAGSDTAPSTNGSRVASSASIPTAPRPASRARALSPPPNSIPPTPTAETSAEVAPVYIASSRELENEITSMFGKAFEGKETEHNWAARDRAITRVRGMLKAEVHESYPDVFFNHLKFIIDSSLKTLASLRTTMVTNTTNMYNELATTLQSDLDPVVETMLIALLKMAGFTKKITAQSSQATVTTLLTYTTPSPRIVINALHTGLQDKTPQARGYIADHLAKYLDMHGGRIKPAVDAGGLLDLLDRTLRKAVADSNPAARQAGRVAYWAFESIWPERALAILNAQDAANRKAIEKSNPHPDASTAPSTATAAPKKSSIAAAIAASRAKAKAIANAPPTLRHQATSAARTISPPKRSMSPSFSTGSTGSPPGSPRSRIVSSSNRGTGTIRPAPAPRMSHSRTSSSDSTPSTSNYNRPASPMVVMPASPPRGTLRRAINTALPGSPPATTTMVVTPPSPAQPRKRPGYIPPTTAAQDRMSIGMPMLDPNEESLLTAVAIPLPDDEDMLHEDGDNSDMEVDGDGDEDEGRGQPLSFSALDERYGPPSPSPAGRASLSRDNSSQSSVSMGRGTLWREDSSQQSLSQSQSRSFSPKGMNNTLSTGTTGSVGSPPAGAPQPLVEDTLRARAERAQNAADRLLELVDPPPPYLPSPPSSQSAHPALNLQSNAAARQPGTPSRPPAVMQMQLPSTPATPANRVWKQAAAFQDSPVAGSGAGAGGTTSLMTDMFRPSGASDSTWWRKRMNLYNRRASAPPADPEQLPGFIAALEAGTADAELLKQAALFCIAHPATGGPLSPVSTGFPGSPSPFSSSRPGAGRGTSDVWADEKVFGRFFAALKAFLTPRRDEELLQLGLIVLWEMMEHLPVLMEDRESDVFAILFNVRYSDKQSVLGSTNVIRDSLCMRVDPIYGLTTMHASLLVFLAEPQPASSSLEAKMGTYAFAVIALGKFVLRLPDEILEEELPRLKGTLISALNESQWLVVREAAASAIIAAQLVLRDETHLFALLDGLADDKKNLLTYLFEKHSARASAGGSTGAEKLEREMRRLDGRTSTPPRASFGR